MFDFSSTAKTKIFVYFLNTCKKIIASPILFIVLLVLCKITSFVEVKHWKKSSSISEALSLEIIFLSSSNEIEVLYKNLKQINERLWKIENEKRLCEKNSDFNEKFIQLARDVYVENDKRSKIKFEINKILGSNIREVKQYTEY